MKPPGLAASWAGAQHRTCDDYEGLGCGLLNCEMKSVDACTFRLAHDPGLVARSPRRWMANFGTMGPNPIARTNVTAVIAFATVAPPHTFEGACESWASCIRPLAILNRKTPGIIDTTEAKPMAANGI